MDVIHIVIVSSNCYANNSIKDNNIAVHKVTDYDSSKLAIFFIQLDMLGVW